MTLKVEFLRDRFERFRLIPWWDQDLLARSTALVIGVGALGNEIVKNLALLGMGRIKVVDLDHVESSNLTRSVLFRERHEGISKAAAAAEAARDLWPGVSVEAHVADVIHSFGWGHLLDADVVMAGLDSREARLSVNRGCIRAGRLFIDGAIEGIDGVARVFDGRSGPCYECTMSERDWELVARRRTCSLLSREEIQAGHVPTTPTISSVIAALQVQQALKALHRLDVQAGVGLSMNGLSFESHRVEYQVNPECYAHDPARQLIRLPWTAAETRIGDALIEAGVLLDGSPVLELRHDLMWERSCRCGFHDRPLRPLALLGMGAAQCPSCSQPLQWSSRSSISPGDLDDLSLSAIGVPSNDIIRFRRDSETLDVVLDGDRSSREDRK